MNRKAKHIPLIIAALLVLGVCAASPFLVSGLQNRNILHSPMADSAVSVGELDIAQRDLSHGEKIKLYLDFGTATSSVTCTRQSNHAGAKLDESTVADAALDEFERLCETLKITSPILDEKREDFKVDECIAATLIDRDDLPRHAIFWFVSLSSSHYQLSVMLDDESGKLYSIIITPYSATLEDDGIIAAEDTWTPPSPLDLAEIVAAYGEYLGFDGVDIKLVAALNEQYGGGSLEHVYTCQGADGDTIEIPFQFGFYDAVNMQISIYNRGSMQFAF